MYDRGEGWDVDALEVLASTCFLLSIPLAFSCTPSCRRVACFPCVCSGNLCMMRRILSEMGEAVQVMEVGSEHDGVEWLEILLEG